MTFYTAKQGVAFPEQPLSEHTDRLSDPARLAALDATGVMDTPSEDVFDRTVRLATTMLGVPVGLVSFVGEARQFFKAQCGLTKDISETPLSHSFCQYVVVHDMTLAVSDARDHPLLRDNLAVPDLGVVAYLGVPIHAPTGETIGSFCAIDDQPRNWTDKDIEGLTDIAAMLETELKLRHERDGMQTLARELNHRVKNLFSIVGGMISLTARSSDTPAEMAQALQGRLSALDWAHDMISPALTDAGAEMRSIELSALIERLLRPHLSPNLDTQVSIDVPVLHLSGRSVTDLALIIHELATNAAKYGALSATAGRISITGTVTDEALLLDWCETGGPQISEAPTETGFGSKLIDLTINRQMQGALDTEWRQTGVSHRLTVPRTVFDTSVETRRAGG